jgi:proteasome accessory factor C
VKLDRMSRLLLLVPLARQRGKQGIPIEEALAALRLQSAEQLVQDVEDMTMVGAPSGTPDGFVDICVEDGRVQVFLPQAFAHPPRFTAVEAAALLAALRPLEAAGLPELVSLREKLQKALPLGTDEALEAALLARSARIEAGAPPAFRAQLEEAARSRQEVELVYFALADGQQKARRVQPRTLLLNGGRWYLAAWSVEKGEEHLYRLDRISEVRLTGQRFAAHRGPPLERYALDQLYIPGGQEQDVVVRFSARIAQAALRDWPETAEQHPDGSVTVRAHLAGENYLISWVLGYGGEAELVEPTALRERLGERVARLRELYAEGGA